MKQETVNCAFCSIVRGEATADLVYRDRQLVAFLDKRPLFPGHVLVVPVQHYQTLGDLPGDLIEPLFRLVQATSCAMESGLGADGSFVAQNNHVSQSVPHLHVHVVPRRFHDGLKHFFWPRQGYESDEHRLQVAIALESAIAREMAQQ